MRTRRTRTVGRVVAGALAVTALWAGGGASGDDAPPPPTRGDAEDDGSMVALRRELERQAQALQATLDDDERRRDWSELLERRRSVDGLLLPLHLARDAVRAAMQPDAPVDLLAALRTEWRDGAVVERWSHPHARERARASIAAWAPPGHGTWIEATAGSDAWVACDAPSTLRWTVEARPGPNGASVDARCWWGFPAVAQARSDFPLPTDGVMLRWDDAGASYRDDRGIAHDERWHAQPIFNNPPDLYAAFDSLRTARAPDAPVRTEPTPADRGTSAADEHVATRTVTRPDGRILAVERWRWDGTGLREIAVDLRPRLLRHHAERGVEIATEVEGAVLGHTPYRATSDIEDLPRGATLVIAFRDPIAGVDRVADGAGAGATVPDRAEWSVGGVRRTWARFESVRALDGRTDSARDARIARLADELAAHRAAMAAFDESIRTGEEGAFLAASQSLAARHEAANLPPARRADEWWIAAARLADGGRPDRAAAVIAGRWRDLVRTPTHAPSAAGCESTAMASITESVANVAFEPVADEASGPADDLRCGTAARQPAMQSALDAITRAIARAGFDAGTARCLVRAVCHAGDDLPAGSTADAFGASPAVGIEQELADALQGGDLPLPEAATGTVGVPAGTDECRTFAAQVLARLGATPADAAAIMDARSAHERASTEAVRILRRSLERAGLEPAEAARIARDAAARLAARRRLIGNRFAPSMDPSRFRPASDPADVEAELGRAGLDAAIDREFSRAAAMHAIARGLADAEDVRAAGQAALADSRARAAEHRVTAIVERAVDRAAARPQN